MLRLWLCLVLGISLPSYARSREYIPRTCPELMVYHTTQSSSGLTRALRRLYRVLRTDEQVGISVKPRENGTAIHILWIQAIDPLRFREIAEEIRQSPELGHLLANHSSGWLLSDYVDVETRKHLRLGAYIGGVSGAAYCAAKGAQWEGYFPWLPPGICTAVGGVIGTVFGLQWEDLFVDLFPPHEIPEEERRFPLKVSKLRKALAEIETSTFTRLRDRDVTAVLMVRQDELPTGIESPETMLLRYGYKPLFETPESLSLPVQLFPSRVEQRPPVFAE